MQTNVSSRSTRSDPLSHVEYGEGHERRGNSAPQRCRVQHLAVHKLALRGDRSSHASGTLEVSAILARLTACGKLHHVTDLNPPPDERTLPSAAEVQTGDPGSSDRSEQGNSAPSDAQPIGGKCQPIGASQPWWRRRSSIGSACRRRPPCRGSDPRGTTVSVRRSSPLGEDLTRTVPEPARRR
jgi:hypothetical protein